MNTIVAITVLSLALLDQVTGINQDAPWHVRPTNVVFRNAVLGLVAGDSQCTPLGSVDTSSGSNSHYVSCEGPTRITDSNKSLPAFTQESHDSVYIWGSQQDRVLFTFSEEKSIDSIVIHYFSNSDNQGLPKLRFYAVPEDFTVQDELQNSYGLAIIDEVRPGREREGLCNKSKTVNYQTSKILMTKDYTKKYQFYVSEVEFFTNDIDSIDAVTTLASTTAAPTTSAATMTTIAETSESSTATSESSTATSESSTASSVSVALPSVGAISSGVTTLPATALTVALATLATLLL